MKASHLTLICSLLCLTLSQASHAAYIKCWKNKQNIRECSGTVPPEYSQQRIEILNEQGIIVKIIPARKTKAQLAEDAREAKRQEARDERRRQDLILLNTFATEKDLILSRDKKLAAIDGAITIATGNLRILASSLEQLQKQAANHERAGKPVPGDMIEDMRSVKTQIAENEKYLAEREKSKKLLNKQYQADLVRYRELKQVKPR